MKRAFLFFVMLAVLVTGSAAAAPAEWPWTFSEESEGIKALFGGQLMGNSIPIGEMADYFRDHGASIRWNRLIPILLGYFDEERIDLGYRLSREGGVGFDGWSLTYYSTEERQGSVGSLTLEFFLELLDLQFEESDQQYPIRYQYGAAKRSGYQLNAPLSVDELWSLFFIGRYWSVDSFFRETLNGTGFVDSDGELHLAAEMQTYNWAETAFRSEPFSGAGFSLGLHGHWVVSDWLTVSIDLDPLFAQERMRGVYVEELQIDTDRVYLDDNDIIRYRSLISGEWSYPTATFSLPRRAVGSAKLSVQWFTLLLELDLLHSAVGDVWFQFRNDSAALKLGLLQNRSSYALELSTPYAGLHFSSDSLSFRKARSVNAAVFARIPF